MANKVVNIFLNTDLRNHHEGLAKIAMKKKVHVGNLEHGEHVIFINSSLNYIKMYSSQGNLLSRKEKGKINLHSIEMIPLSFDSKGKIDWEKADRLALEKQLTKHDKRKVTKDVQAEARA